MNESVSFLDADSGITNVRARHARTLISRSGPKTKEFPVCTIVIKIVRRSAKSPVFMRVLGHAPKSSSRVSTSDFPRSHTQILNYESAWTWDIFWLSRLDENLTLVREKLEWPRTTTSATFMPACYA
jgi:hypothetical protein